MSSEYAIPQINLRRKQAQTQLEESLLGKRQRASLPITSQDELLKALKVLALGVSPESLQGVATTAVSADDNNTIIEALSRAFSGIEPATFGQHKFIEGRYKPTERKVTILPKTINSRQRMKEFPPVEESETSAFTLPSVLAHEYGHADSVKRMVDFLNNRSSFKGKTFSNINLYPEDVNTFEDIADYLGSIFTTSAALPYSKSLKKRSKHFDLLRDPQLSEEQKFDRIFKDIYGLK